MDIKLMKKTYRKIDNIAKGGVDNIFLYKDLINEIIKNDEYDILYELMLRYYKIDIKTFLDYDELKNNTFEQIRLLTHSTYEENVKRLQKRLNFYNIGLNIYDGGTNDIIGQIFELGNIHYVVTKNDNKIVVEGNDDFDIYNKSINIIYTEYNQD